MTATIMLAKPYTPRKLVFPVMVSEKLDGVPALIHITIKDLPGAWVGPTVHAPMKPVLKWTAQTRQAKPFPSIAGQCEAFGETLMNKGCKGTFVFVAEVTHTDADKPFKDVSGLCRQHEQCDELMLNVFDFYRPTDAGPDLMPFGKRIVLAAALVRSMHWCRMIPQCLCGDEFELARALTVAKMQRSNGFIPEGAVIRNCNDKWQAGKRGWGYQKVVEDPTTEVWITDFEEAISQDGEPLGMVGRLNGDWQGQRIGVGPGKLTHDDRRTLWINGCVPMWATVKYKRDPSYEKLRQPTFQHWRPDYTPEGET